MKKHKLSLPHIYVLVMLFIFFMALMTWIVPSGQYDRQDIVVGSSTKSVPIDGTYHHIDKVDEEGNDSRQGLFAALQAPLDGLQASSDVVGFVLIVGGAFALLNKTGAIVMGMQTLIRKLGNRSILIIPITMILFGLGGTTFGMAEELLPFYLIIITMLFGMGYDSMTAFLVVFLGSGMGVAASTVNPFATLIAQGIAGIAGNPQLWFRCIQFVILEALAIAFVLLYARKVKANPQSSMTYVTDQAWKQELKGEDGIHTEVQMTLRQKLVLAEFIICFAIIIYGLIVKGWFMTEMAAMFLLMGILAGLIGGLNVNEMGEEFVAGMKDFVYAGVIIGISRGVLCVAENGLIIDTILNSLVNFLGSVPVSLYVVAMYFVQVVLSIFVPTTSGVAALSMPIMAPLTEMLGLNPEGAVTCFQYACKLTLMLSPAAPVTVAGIAMCRLTFQQWWKIIWKFMLLIVVLTIGFSIMSSLLPV